MARTRDQENNYHRMPIGKLGRKPVVDEFNQLTGKVADPTMMRDMNKMVDKSGVYYKLFFATTRNVGMHMLRNALFNTPSIQGALIPVLTMHEVKEGRVGLDLLEKPFSTLWNVHLFSKPRGWEDLPLIIPNRIITALTLLAEYPLKIVGDGLSKLARWSWDGIWNKKYSNGKRAAYGAVGLLIGIPLLVVGQVFNCAGNVFGSLRRTVDAACNVFSSILAFATGNNAKYPSVLSSIGSLINNGIKLAVNAAVVAAVVLIPGAQIAPAAATGLTAALATFVPSTATASVVGALVAKVGVIGVAVMPTATQFILGLYTKCIVNPLTSGYRKLSMRHTSNNQPLEGTPHESFSGPPNANDRLQRRTVPQPKIDWRQAGSLAAGQAPPTPEPQAAPTVLGVQESPLNDDNNKANANAPLRPGRSVSDSNA